MISGLEEQMREAAKSLILKKLHVCETRFLNLRRKLNRKEEKSWVLTKLSFMAQGNII